MVGQSKTSSAIGAGTSAVAKTRQGKVRVESGRPRLHALGMYTLDKIEKLSNKRSSRGIRDKPIRGGDV